MNSRKYLLIADDSSEFCNGCKAALDAKGFETILCRKDGHLLLQLIGEYQPKAVLMEAFMSGLDALGVLNAVNNGDCHTHPIMVTMSNVDGPGISSQLIKAGSAYHFVKPFDPRVLADRIEMFMSYHPAAEQITQTPRETTVNLDPSLLISSWKSVFRRISRATSISVTALFLQCRILR